eukprot:TRINITY_DN55846_c0_g1_i1.p1 TRINITY_DN55846_c0_g1~~TRINITY_DN55846_c0_g1_i1.p1  ORF type:complete len:137 (+),score=5.00 TRINITY_DN55846_c0_g1_i1:247-657(+)
MRGCSNLRSIQLGNKLCNNKNALDEDDDDVRADTTCTAPNILEKVVCIQNNFLAQCPKPRSIDLSPLGNVSSIGGYFMKDCKGLESLDLAPLSKLPPIHICEPTRLLSTSDAASCLKKTKAVVDGNQVNILEPGGM